MFFCLGLFIGRVESQDLALFRGKGLLLCPHELLPKPTYFPGRGHRALCVILVCCFLILPCIARIADGPFQLTPQPRPSSHLSSSVLVQTTSFPSFDHFFYCGTSYVALSMFTILVAQFCSIRCLCNIVTFASIHLHSFSSSLTETVPTKCKNMQCSTPSWVTLAQDHASLCIIQF